MLGQMGGMPGQQHMPPQMQQAGAPMMPPQVAGMYQPGMGMNMGMNMGYQPQQPMYNNQQQQQPNQPQMYDQQQQMQQQQQQQQPRMDADQVPSPIEVMEVNNSKFGNGRVFETNEAGKVPPLNATDFICTDAGNCNPRFIRSSLYSVPANPDLLKQSKLPMVLNLTPFAELRKEEVNYRNK